MKNHLTKLAVYGGVLVLSATAQAQYSVFNNTISTQFQNTPIDPSGTGTLGFSDALTTPSGSTISGGSSVNFATGTAIGETFLWSGASTTLTAFSFVDTGGGGATTYQPFLFDLGTSTYGGSATGFIPGNFSNLLPTGTVQPPALSSGLNAVEIDLTTPVNLVSGQSYALGFQATGSVDLNFQKSSGGQSDPNGEGFTFSGGLSSSSADNPSPFSGSPRNLFVGLYTVAAVPEPSTYALFGGGLALLGLVRRFRK
jgi:hypothetical protein